MESATRGPATPAAAPAGSVRRLATETKSAVKTTEFWAYVGILIALFIAGAVLDSSDEATDRLTANEVWLFAVILTFAYMFSRGRAKSGSSDPYSWQPDDAEGGRAAYVGRRFVTETKQAFKTTEFWAYVLMLIALFIAGASISADADTTDTLTAEEVWLYAIILTAGYLVSRGLAKAGSRDPYWDDRDTGGDSPGVGERVRAAAQTLREGTGGETRR